MLGQKAQVDRTGQIEVVGPRNVGVCDWSQPLDKQSKVQARALKHMGFEEFRPFQREIVTAAMGKEIDIIVQMPTNAGKTTLFALPALFNQCGQCALNRETSACTKAFAGHKIPEGTYETCRSFTLVLSPLVALIDDQVERLRSHYHVPTINLETAESTQMNNMLTPMPCNPKESDSEIVLVPAKLALLTPEKITVNHRVQEADPIYVSTDTHTMCCMMILF